MESNTSRELITLDDRFTLLNKIGEGGFGSIYLVQDNESKSYGALKLNRNEQTDEIEREIAIMSEMTHYNILEIKAYSVGKGKLFKGKDVISENSTYFVMPLIGKGDLGSYLR